MSNNLWLATSLLIALFMTEKSAQEPEYSEKTQDPELKALIDAAKSKDERAFGRIYEFYFEKIYKFIYFRVNHKEIAEDLAEDVFVKAWSRIHHVNADSFGGWLYSIAKNTVIDYYRKKRIVVDLEDIENVMESEQNVMEDANTVMEKKVFLGLLKNLTPEQQIIIKLKFMEDLDNAEIAELISKSEGSIRVIQHRAIQKLQQLLDEQLELTKLIEKKIDAEN